MTTQLRRFSFCEIGRFPTKNHGKVWVYGGFGTKVGTGAAETTATAVQRICIATGIVALLFSKPTRKVFPESVRTSSQNFPSHSHEQQRVRATKNG
ncbi:MAG TPA: hypothetical protein VHX63_13000 [Acidobacteriaceae bacterium]|nr:hypothetical protein [Acidobacteriaceae bacterium]